MSRYWSPRTRALTPYTPGEQPRVEGLVKLNTNELPWPPSERVLDVIRHAGSESLRLYPDPESSALCEAFATAQGILPSQVFVGNGSDEVLAHTFQALFQPDQPVLFPDISYSFYPVYCALYELQYETPALSQEFEITLEDYERKNGGIIFPNPNAPTGRQTGLAEIEGFLQRNQNSVVVIDEAYIDFGGDTATPLINRYPNLLVVQTLSKSRGLAGLRVGAAFGDEQLIEGLQRVKNSFNSYPLDRLAQSAAIAALEDKVWFKNSCARLIELREDLVGKLSALGFAVVPSVANFLFVRHPQIDARALSERLRKDSILVRHFDNPRIDQYLRITVGDEKQCESLLKSLSAILG